VEQNAPEDAFCLEAYCKSFGVQTLKRNKIRKDTTVIQGREFNPSDCPRYDQIRLLAIYDVAAKGPMFARSLARKILGNEEYCMQIDAHSDFSKNWDEIAKQEWKNTENEFGIITNVPASKTDMPLYEEGSEVFTQVPRQCKIIVRQNGFPDYESPADGKAADLEKPLLGHGWSAAFSFAKCHLEEIAPYDPFALYAMPVEQYSRYARAWTRG
jgi:hypothetical protein